MAGVVWERRECVSTDIEDSLVVLDLEQLVYHSLNRTAAVIWVALEKPGTEDFVVEQLCRQFAVTPEVCRPAVTRMLAQFASDHLASARPLAAAKPEVMA